MKALSLVVWMVGMLVTPVWADSPSDGPAYEAAYQLYLQGAEGDKKATRQALEDWQRLQRANPEDPLALALLGASRTLLARDAWMPWNKMNHAEQGLAELDKARQLLRPEHDMQGFGSLPVSIHVNSLAGITFTQVPDFFGYFEPGYQLLLETSQSPLLNDIPAEHHSYIHHFAAKAAARAEETDRQRELQRRLAELPVNDEYTSAAREALAEVQ